MISRLPALAIALALIAVACSSAEPSDTTTAAPTSTTSVTNETSGQVQLDPAEGARLRNQLGFALPEAPEVPTGPLPAGAIDDQGATTVQRARIPGGVRPRVCVPNIHR